MNSADDEYNLNILAGTALTPAPDAAALRQNWRIASTCARRCIAGFGTIRNRMAGTDNTMAVTMKAISCAMCQNQLGVG